LGQKLPINPVVPNFQIRGGEYPPQSRLWRVNGKQKKHPKGGTGFKNGLTGKKSVGPKESAVPTYRKPMAVIGYRL